VYSPVVPPMRPSQKPPPADREVQEYALGKANEAFGHKSSNGFRTEIFIVIVLMTAMWLAMKDC